MYTVGRGLSALLLSLSILCASAGPSAAVTGGEVAETCANYPNGSKPKTCELYVSSMIEIVNSDDKYGNPKGRLCIGETVPMADIIGLINTWLAAHPQLHSKSGYDATYGVLAEHYRCK